MVRCWRNKGEKASKERVSLEVRGPKLGCNLLKIRRVLGLKLHARVRGHPHVLRRGTYELNAMIEPTEGSTHHVLGVGKEEKVKVVASRVVDVVHSLPA